MKTSLSERKELLIKEIISLIKRHDFSKGSMSFENKIENINIYSLYKNSDVDIFLLSIFNIYDKQYRIVVRYYNPDMQHNTLSQSILSLREFKKIFNDLPLLDLFLIKIIIKQRNLK